MSPTALALIIGGASLCLIVLLVMLGALYMIAPGRRGDKMKKYIRYRYAHRGLHDSVKAENTLSAITEAAAAGYGIELDVRLSKDGELVVFHDSSLFRATGVDRRVVDCTTEELAGLSVFDTAEGVPTLRAVLDAVDGSVPLLIEMKIDEGNESVPDRLALELEGYGGDVIVESFNPMALRRLKKLRPDSLRGILSMEYSRVEEFKGKLIYKLLQGLYFNFMIRPDFIAYEKTGHAVRGLRFVRKTFGTPLIAWTITSPDEEMRAFGDGFDAVIFEGYIPDN